LRYLGRKWINGTVLHYCFFNKPKEWTTREEEKDIVRKGFKIWMDVGIGIKFEEISSISDAEVRIAFLRDGSTWSGVGTDILKYFGKDEMTMNFGWDLILEDANGIDTAVHEIGHTCGFPHEHQNPKSGIQWNRAAVIDLFSGPPNNWDVDKIEHNILNTIVPDLVEGSAWDPDSIMHYSFEKGLILKPEKYQNQPLIPAGGLSARDKEWVKTFYPPITARDYQKLELLKSQVMQLGPGEQKNYLFEAPYTDEFTFRTIGKSDTVMVLFEDQGANAEPRYIQGDDDSGEDRNALITAHLAKGSKYILRVRLYWAKRSGSTAVIVEEAP